MKLIVLRKKEVTQAIDTQMCETGYFRYPALDTLKLENLIRPPRIYIFFVIQAYKHYSTYSK